MNLCPSARLGVQAEQARSRGTGCTEWNGGSWAEGASQRAGGNAPSLLPSVSDRHRMAETTGSERNARRARAEGNARDVAID